jgi:iron complex transport system substrate-binding protein
MRKLFCEILNKEINLPFECHKIVSFSPAVTEALFAMGLEDKIKGVSTYCVRPPTARKKVIIGSYNTCKKEVLYQLAPDIIFTTTGYQLEFAKKLSQEFPVWTIRLPSTLSELIATITEAGLVAGYPIQARQLQINLFYNLSQNNV